MATRSSSRDSGRSYFRNVEPDDRPTIPLLTPSPGPSDAPAPDALGRDAPAPATGGRLRLNLVSHNLWLIPFGAPLFLGRADRCAANLGAAADRLRQHPGSEGDAAAAVSAGAGAGAGRDNDGTLTVVCAQELWALRVGVFWPVLWCFHQVEACLLLLGWVGGGRENPVYWFVKSVVLLVVAVANLVLGWVPLLRWVLWDPKVRAAATLRKQHGLPWSVSGVGAFRHHAPWRLLPMPVLMDSGLMLSASAEPDDHGFVAFDAAGNSEAVALKGVLWARFDRMAVVTTHMTFVNSDGGAQRRAQQTQLATVIKCLLDDSAVGSVVLCGDFNHCLPEQTAAEFPNNGPGQGSPSVFRTAWLPQHASTTGLCDALGLGGTFEVTRVSGDAPTCEDGTVDHIFHIAPAAVAPAERGCAVVAMESVPDHRCRFSDHCMVRAILDLTTAASRQIAGQRRPYYLSSV